MSSSDSASKLEQAEEVKWIFFFVHVLGLDVLRISDVYASTALERWFVDLYKR
jgi:hypothetical protein